jgi:dienelactone hydrolase
MSEAKQTSCCPPGSHPPKRTTGPHKAKGEYKKFGDVECYVSGEGKSGCGILVNPEVFGIKTGDLVEFCDYLADNSFFVVMPDYHRGTYFSEFPKDFNDFIAWVKKWPFSTLQKDLENTIFPIFAKAGVKNIGCVGFCFGTWVNYHIAQLGKVKALINFHPSHFHAAKFQGEDAAELVAACKVPVLQFAAGNDPEETKPGGRDEKAIKANGKAVCFKEYAAEAHGWVSRGDRKNEKTYQAQLECWQAGLDFAKTHVCA